MKRQSNFVLVLVPGKHWGSPKAIEIVLYFCFFKLETIQSTFVELYKPHCYKGDGCSSSSLLWNCTQSSCCSSRARANPFVGTNIMKHPLTQFIHIIKHQHHHPPEEQKACRAGSEQMVMVVPVCLSEWLSWHLATSSGSPVWIELRVATDVVVYVVQSNYSIQEDIKKAMKNALKCRRLVKAH